MARTEQTIDSPAGISPARRKRFKALIDTGEAFKDVPVDQIERDVAQLVREDRQEQQERRARKPVPAPRS